MIFDETEAVRMALSVGAAFILAVSMVRVFIGPSGHAYKLARGTIAVTAGNVIYQQLSILHTQLSGRTVGTGIVVIVGLVYSVYVYRNP